MWNSAAKRAERPEPEAEGDDAEMLDAAIGEEPFGVALKHDEAGRDQDRQRAEEHQQPVGEAAAQARSAPAARSA